MIAFDLNNQPAFGADELRRLIYMDAIKTITQEMMDFQELQPLCDHVVTVLQHRLHFHITRIFRYDELYQVATLVAQKGDDEQSVLSGAVQSVHMGFLGWALREGKTLLIDDTSKLPDYVVPEGTTVPAHSVLCVPIYAGKVLWGAFHVENTTAGSFVYYDQTAFELIATYLGSTIAHLELYKQQQRLLQPSTSHEEHLSQLATQLCQLSLPLFPVHPGMLALPLVGQFDSERMQHIRTTLLASLEQTPGSIVLLDIAGVTHLEQPAAQHLRTLLQESAARSTAVILTGVQPDVERYLTQLDIQQGHLTRYATFAAGMTDALRRYCSDNP